MRVTTTDLQNAFGKYLALVEQEEIIVVKNEKSVAKLCRYTDPEAFIIHEEAKNYRSTRKISYEEYMDLVNSSDQRYELIDGEIYLLASPTFKHQVIVNEIAAHFYRYFKGKPCRSLTAPLDVKLFGLASKFEENPNVVQPDIMVICDEEKVTADSKYEGIPTLIVEVLSPSTKRKDLAAKLNLYMNSGVSEYWIVDPDEKTALQYIFNKERDIESLKTFSQNNTVYSTVLRGWLYH